MYISYIHIDVIFQFVFIGSDRKTMKNPGLATAALLLALMDV